MRLIDVEAFKDKFIKEHELYFNPAEARAVHCIFDALDNAPTAYDVEKVIAEVREQALCKRCLNNHNPVMVCAEFCDLGKRLEIVRKGGVE